MKPLPEITRCSNRDTETPGRLSLFIGNPEDDAVGVYTMPGKELVTGYFLKKGNPVLLTVDLVSYKNEPTTVYVSTEFDYIEGEAPAQVDTSMQTWRLAECDKVDEYLAVDIPKGQNKFTLKSKEMKVLRDGYFFYGSKLQSYSNSLRIC